MEKNKLHPSLIVLFLVFLPADASVSGQPQYMALVPSLLHTETPEKACILLSHLNETVTVSVSLDSLRKNESLFTNLVAEKDLFRCVSFTVPRSPSSEEVMLLSVQVKGATHEFRRQTAVLVKNQESLVFVQTDKPIYKPGQTVKFRVVSLDENFHPLNELIPLVSIEDPKGNRIAQWQKVKLESGLKQLAFPLSSEPFLGSYKVLVKKESGETAEHPFTVQEFVLPKFEVQVTVPKIITISDEEVNVSVCGLYTYGKPVPGRVTLSMCRKYYNPSNCFGGESQALCEKLSQKLNSQGCVSQQVKTKVFQMKREGLKMELEVEAKIKEEGTEVELTGRGLSEITRTITQLSFVKVDPHFRQGIPFFGQVRLVDGKGVPMQNKLIHITANAANYVSNATTDQFGLAQFSINTTNVKDSSLSVRVKYKDQSHCYDHQWLAEEHRDAYHTATRVFSPSKSFVHLETIPDELRCGQTQTIQAHYVLNGQVLKELRELTFYYLIMAKGGIVRTGFHVLPVKQEDMKGHFPVSVPVEPDIAPVARLLIYAILPDGEVVGDSAKYEVENCLANKVDLTFKPAVSLPASPVHLRVTASPQSLCALRAVDQSVLLMKPEAELSPSSVYNLLPVKDLTGFPGSLNQQEETNVDCVSDQIHINGIIYSPMSSTNEKDMYSFLQDMGLKVFTNSKIHKPRVCSYYHPQSFGSPGVARLYEYSERMSMRGSSNYVLGASGPVPEPVTETVRKYFPETWIWDLVVVDSSGVAEVGVTVPDTITEWKAGAFCLSDDTGIGLSLPTTLRAFQPFFVELTMPYSVIRGEAFTLKATVLNYLPNCIRVKVHLEASPAFLAVPGEKEQDSHCICGNGRQTVTWAVTPKSLGDRQIPKTTQSYSKIVCQWDSYIYFYFPQAMTPLPQMVGFFLSFILGGAEVPDQVSLKLPPNVVEDSARASFSVLGLFIDSNHTSIPGKFTFPKNLHFFTPANNLFIYDSDKL
ncbi:alpha-2-macroglobulin-like [Myotis myotis]|uniref:alpha-2-macroglobulin-like n=1 Tax=Myotis myotis TaxID=51298 RepID=UPI001749AD28|nr:alpha-2-macroglobulin-like [Myotis myotis]